MNQDGLRDESGQALILIAIALAVMTVIFGLVVDGSNAWVQRQNIQNVADATALAAAADLAAGTCTTRPCVETTINKYLTLNGFASATPIQQCSAHAPPCYTWPYQSNNGKVEVQIKETHNNFLGGVLHVAQTSSQARAVGVLGPGTPPPYSFVSLNQSCDNHTLVIRLGGHLTVTNAIYVDSCNGLGSATKGDAFDIFGAGGTLTDPVDILVHGGWETHNNDLVYVGQDAGGNPIKCNLSTAGSGTAWQLGCPHTGQPILADPFAKLTPPAIFNPIVNTTCTTLNPCYNATEFSPPFFLDSSIASGSTSLIADAGGVTNPPNPPLAPVANGTSIQVDNERMKLTANSSGAPGGGVAPPTSETFGSAGKPLARGQLGTSAAAHSETLLTAVAARRASNVVTVSTCPVGHGLAIGDWARVNLTVPNNNQDGVWTVTEVPDDETNSPPCQFSYVIPGAVDNTKDFGAANVVAVGRSTAGEARVTVDTAPTPAFAVGQTVVLDMTSAVDVDPISGESQFNEDLEDAATIDSVTPDGLSFTYSQAGLGAVTGPTLHATLVNRFEGTSYVQTQENTASSLLPGMFATVANTSFNGDGEVTTVGKNADGTNNANAFGSANAGPDVPADVLQNTVTAWQRDASGLVTLSAPTGGLAANQYVIVHLNDAANTTFNGKFKVTKVNFPANNQFQYQESCTPTCPPAVALTNRPAGSTQNSYDNLLTVTAYSRNATGLVTVTTSANNGFMAGKTDAIVDVGDSTFDGTYRAVSAAGKTFTYQQSCDPMCPPAATPAIVAGDGVTTNAVKPGAALDATGGTVAVDQVLGSGIYGFESISTCSGCGVVADPFEIFSVSTTAVTAATQAMPSEYVVPAGSTKTLNPGTYYGGLCLGTPNGGKCGTKVGGSCQTGGSATDVTMNPGIYIMAGGGFFACGNTTLHAAGVMIYNTIDSAASPAGQAAAQLDQVLFNTNGNVTLSGLQDGSAYNNMTIYQGSDPAVTGGANLDLDLAAKCDNRAVNLTDIVLEHAGNGLNGFSGTIYAPNPNSLFNDSVSGTANMAVITGCIYIAGATSTFNFDGSGLAGLGATLGE